MTALVVIGIIFWVLWFGYVSLDSRRHPEVPKWLVALILVGGSVLIGLVLWAAAS